MRCVLFWACCILLPGLIVPAQTESKASESPTGAEQPAKKSRTLEHSKYADFSNFDVATFQKLQRENVAMSHELTESRKSFRILQMEAVKDPAFGGHLRKLCPTCLYNSIDPEGNPFNVVQLSGGRACPPAPSAPLTSGNQLEAPAQLVVDIVEKLAKSDTRWAQTIATLKSYPPAQQLDRGLRLIDQILTPLYPKGDK